VKINQPNLYKIKGRIKKMNAKDKAREGAKEYLRQIIKPGDTVYTSVKHVSRSGMYRVINLYVVKDSQISCIDNYASDLLQGYDERHYGCKASGCGMDMGFALVYNLSYALYPDYECIASPLDNSKRCPSNEHVNDWKSPKGEGVIHHDGYAISQRWM
jgi:hypothetical protein